MLVLSAVSSNIGSAEALKSQGTPNTKFGKDTSSIVCGDKLCSEIPKNTGRGDFQQQEAPVDPLAPLHMFGFNLEQEGVILNGKDGYLHLERNNDAPNTLNSTSTDTLSAVTVAAWIEPNFEKSFGEYSIISKEKSFDLYVDNLNYPTRTANFAIYDGITWTVAKTKNIIPQGWFHLAGVFEKETVSLYVNGKLQSEVNVKPIRMVDENGKTVERTVDKLRSEGLLSVGSYHTYTKYDGEKDLKKFSGNIDDVQVYGFPMHDSEIAEMYKQKSSTYDERTSQELIDDGILE